MPVEIRPERSPCPISTTLDVVGDKWSLIIVRDMLTGKKRFGEFLSSPERIPTNILTNRLKRLENTGLVKKAEYSNRPQRFDYQLTERGRGLLPVLQEISRWANRHVPETWTPPDWFMRAQVTVSPPPAS